MCWCTPQDFFISTHAPAGGATRRHIERRPDRSYFYSRPCGRGDRFAVNVIAFPKISTHAPAGGATRSFRTWLPTRKISTHAPAGGATKIKSIAAICKKISTHAPAGGATDDRVNHKNGCNIFLLTPLREGRPMRGARSASRIYFYSRPCGRGDQKLPCFYHPAFLFLLTPLREGRRAA